MTTEAIKLKLEPRHLLGKKVKRLRRAGMVPIHLYGPGVESRSLQCQAQKLIQVLSIAGGNTPISVSIEGEPGNQLAFAREIQWDPRRDDLFHVDFLVAEANRPVSAQVPIVLTGESSGARIAGGTIMQQLHQLDVQALPLEMPSEAELDLSILTESDSVGRVGDISFPANVTILTDPEEVIVRIESARVEGEAVVQEGDEEAAGETPSAADGQAGDGER